MTGSIGQTSSGGIFIGGTVSKLDTTALIDAAVAQKRIASDRLQVEVDNNVTKIGAYSQLETLAGNFQNSLSALRGSGSLFDEGQNIFDARTGVVSVSNGTDYLNYATIAVDSNAEEASYSIEIIQNARVQKVQSSDVADNTAALNYTGAFDIGLSGGGTQSTINIVAGDSLVDLAAKINAESDITGVNANIVKVSETSYRLVLEGEEFNQEISVTNTSGDDVLALMNVTDGVGGFDDQIQAARGAEILVDGVTITRDDNNFDDVITGIDIDIKAATAGEVITLEITNDIVGVKDAINSFIDSYNAIRDFVVQNRQISAGGVVSEDSILFGDRILGSFTNAVSDLLTQNFGNGGDIQTIRDLGITIGENNQLSISDEVALDAAILNNFDDVRAAFASSVQSDNADFALLRNTSTLGSRTIVFDITHDGTNITGVTADGDAGAFTIDGTSIVGNAGTIYAGLRFSYQGNVDATINLDLTQGLANRLSGTIDNYTDSTNGLIGLEKSQLQTENIAKLEDAETIIERAEAFRARQIEKYGEFEAKLQALEILKSQIRAILGTDNDDD